MRPGTYMPLGLVMRRLRVLPCNVGCTPWPGDSCLSLSTRPKIIFRCDDVSLVLTVCNFRGISTSPTQRIACSTRILAHRHSGVRLDHTRPDPCETDALVMLLPRRAPGCAENARESWLKQMALTRCPLTPEDD